MNKEQMIQQLERDKEQITDPMVKKAIEQKIKEVSQDNTIQK